MKVAIFLMVSCLYPALLQAAPVSQSSTQLLSVAGSSNWVSRHGSVMVLDIAANGQIQGYFVNNAPGKGCRGVPYKLDGRIKGSTIAFQVRWRNGLADCMAETEWRGHVQPSRNGGLELIAEWQRTSTAANAVQREDVIERGVDFFTHLAIPGLQASVTP